MPVISLQHLSKKYPIYHKPSDKLKELLTLRKRAFHDEFWALHDINLNIESGSTVGIIGANGSGKSTLLQLVAGILRPSLGVITVRGKVAALLELGAGFNPNFTGRENVYMNASILGLQKAEVDERFSEIEQFASIGEFIDQPVKTYSSGMFMRLAFAVAINVDPEVLLVDEALAVGDIVFQHRCMHRIDQLRRAGKTILFVSHDLQAVTRFCDRTVLLDRGSLIEDGEPYAVVQKYLEIFFERERRQKQLPGDDLPVIGQIDPTITVVNTIPHMDHRFGNGRALIHGILVLNTKHQVLNQVRAEDLVIVRITARVEEKIEYPIIGFTLRDHLNVEISSTNTSYEKVKLPPANTGDYITVDFRVRIPPMRPGSYSISPAVASGNIWEHDICDWIDNAYILTLVETELVYGMWKLEVEASYRVTH
ncbi:MAG TPA: ABC transporter ATP-binding protein [Acidobacteriota bacterium]|nr:ABC transporter ATP-binding protein [Acidobacteriota bacterium]